MDMKRKKQLLWEYKNRKPEMGILSFYCIPTKESFLGYSKDTKADINSSSFKLDANYHPNPSLQKLWNEYGKENFEVTVLEVLAYDKDGVKEDYTKELEQLLACYLEQVEHSRRLHR